MVYYAKLSFITKIIVPPKFGSFNEIIAGYLVLHSVCGKAAGGTLYKAQFLFLVSYDKLTKEVNFDKGLPWAKGEMIRWPFIK